MLSRRSIAALVVMGLSSGCQVGMPTHPGTACDGQEIESERLLLLQPLADGIMVKWRGEAEALCVGSDPANLDLKFSATSEGGYKVARVTGLAADSRYHYSVGAARQSRPDQTFQTAPEVGTVPSDGHTQLWLLGDSGTASDIKDGKAKYPTQAAAVRDGYFKYNRESAGGEPLDLLLLLGDNAYTAGTDKEWQKAFFDLYPQILSSTAVYPTIGNHEMGYALVDYCDWYDLPGCENGPKWHYHGGISASADPNSYDGNADGDPDNSGPPYLEIFTLPAQGEVGGVASGTEQYYSADYANIHLVSLDSQLTPYDEGQLLSMRDWLIDDLSANEQDWTVVIFHHPPYSRGMNHDSDFEAAQVTMRIMFGPIFEQHGVDVVYSGHAHSYERSWYLNGHHGPASSFDAAQHAEPGADGAAGLGQEGEPYRQTSPSSGIDDKAVYTVAGSAGKITTIKGQPPCRPGQFAGCNTGTWLQHPAHRTFDASIEGYEPHGVARLGSVVLDISKDRLVSRFIDVEGAVLDHFVIEK